jgi:hypothetical protein
MSIKNSKKISPGIKDELSDVNDDIEALVDGDTDTMYVSAKATARVKAIYVKEGESVKDAIEENGALALLSLDGLMSVSFESETKLKRGNEVTERPTPPTPAPRAACPRRGKVRPHRRHSL